MAGDVLADARSGKKWSARIGRVVPAVAILIGRLAGYEGVNDAEPPAPRSGRWIVGGKAAQRSAASSNQMGRFETQWLAAPKNFAALADLSGQWIDPVHGRRPRRGTVLDMDLSVSPTHGERVEVLRSCSASAACAHEHERGGHQPRHSSRASRFWRV